MTTAREVIANTPLAGHELARLILADAQALVESDCMLTSSVAYGRVSYELRLTLHIDNPAFPLSESTFRSHRRAAQEVLADPAMAALELHPLTPPTTESAFLSAIERHRAVESPNAARVESGLPITVTTRDNSGHYSDRQVQYPQDYADGANPPPIDSDVSAAEAARLSLPDSSPTRAKLAATVETSDAIAILANEAVEAADAPTV